MKKFKYSLLIVVGLLAGVVLLIIGKTILNDNSEKIILNIDGKNYILFTARTVLERTRGLSGIKELKGADGMVFFFDSAGRQTFWNKNTHLDLDIIWMRNNKVVGRDFLPSEDKAGLITKTPLEEVDMVVEIIKMSIDKK